MRKVVTLLAMALTVAACEKDTPLGNVPHVGGVYAGEWLLSWQTNNPASSITGLTAVCPGQITLDNEFRDALSGSFIIRAEGDCFEGSPVSGELLDGRLRVDGGLNFTLAVPPTLGQEKFEDDIWEDVFAGSAVIFPDLIIGCLIIDADNQMTGAIENGALGASASAGVACPQTPNAITQVQIRFRSVVAAPVS
jgi:hypothetical protein